ncbi:hypothetical protein IX39_16995 [Chryseobacterium formosense]|uniref:Uncharacterized protein n=1 Tax=Chryseobacterium formosense TaxID=236814 RepID=A0A085Z0X8_9FLAO|nr:hypothetical protein IX39_16995 [Chryseobacterium formosense]
MFRIWIAVESCGAGNLRMNCGIIFINHHFVFCCSSNKYKNILDSMRLESFIFLKWKNLAWARLLFYLKIIVEKK